MAVVLGITACNEESTVLNQKQTDPHNNPVKNATSEPSEPLQPILSTVYQYYYDHFMAPTHGSLDFANSGYVTYDSITAYRIPSLNSIATGSNEVQNVPSAVLYAIEASNGNYLTYVVTFNNASFINGEVTGSIGLSLINGVEFGKIDQNGLLQDGSDVNDIPNIAMPGWNEWWACTTGCYADAKDACGNDPECDFLCDLANLVGGCTLSIAAACGIHCADQGIAPPTDYGNPVQAPINDPKCFF